MLRELDCSMKVVSMVSCVFHPLSSPYLGYGLEMFCYYEHSITVSNYRESRMVGHGDLA
jgi:hypothetical protein